MGLSRFAVPRPFVVAAADGTRDRLAAEAGLRRRGWRAALSPAETGMLVVCGVPGAALAEAIETVWRDMPEPRVRASADLVGAGGGVRPRLDLDAGMADRAEDRDGLRLDVLHVPLGPVLSLWPAGLRVDLVLQGDVVQAAEAHGVDTAEGTFWTEERLVPARLDSLSRLLRVAGWDAAGERAALLRDEALGGVPGDVLRRRFGGFARRVRRSRSLAWMTRGVGRGPDGDVKDRLDGWLREIGEALDGRRSRPRPGRAESLQALPALLAGEGAAEARLVVASLDPDLADG